jgi:hypothetical protein
MGLERINGLMQQPLEDKLSQHISRRAYQLYELRGGLVGDEVADWLQAEGEVLAASAGQEPARASGAEGTCVGIEGSNGAAAAAKPRRKKAPEQSAPKRKKAQEKKPSSDGDSL